MNLTTLRATIRAYSENDFPQTVGSGGLSSDEQVDTFIRQAEERIFNSVQFPNFRKNQTGNTTGGNKYLATPVDFLAPYSLAVILPTGEYEYLLNKDVNYIRAAYPSPTYTGAPRYYALFDDNTFILAPTPDVNYTMELHYFYFPESITTAGTTWLGDNFDMTLLYGALSEAATFMKAEPDVIANYAKRYEEAMILAKRMGDGMDRRDSYRSGQVRMSVN
jgi:hypothetical protein